MLTNRLRSIGSDFTILCGTLSSKYFIIWIKDLNLIDRESTDRFWIDTITKKVKC